MATGEQAEPDLTVDNAATADIYLSYGGCDPLMRRHAQASRPALLQRGRTVMPAATIIQRQGVSPEWHAQVPDPQRIQTGAGSAAPRLISGASRP